MNSRVIHCFEPIYNSESRILILGTMPSPASRQQGFYYSHPRNRFWPVMADIFGEAVPITPDKKHSFALRNRFALWDVLAACSIDGASDASIRQPEVNDLERVFRSAEIKAVFTTGAKASQLYSKLCVPLGMPVNIPLPSTSPANARASLDGLVSAYSVILDYLH